MEENEVMMEFKRRKKKQIFAVILLLPVMFIDVWDTNTGQDSGELGCILRVLLILGIIIFSFKNWRCPSCNAYLGKRMSMKHCPNCGEKLAE